MFNPTHLFNVERWAFGVGHCAHRKNDCDLSRGGSRTSNLNLMQRAPSCRSGQRPARICQGGRAIDLNRLRTNVPIAVPKKKRPGQFTLLGRSEVRLPASPAQARLETFPIPRHAAIIGFISKPTTSLRFVQSRANPTLPGLTSITSLTALRRKQIAKVLSRFVSE